MRRYRHIEHLLKFYYRELPARREITEEDLRYTRKRMQELEAFGPYASAGVARVDGTGAHGAGGYSDSTGWAALSSPEKREWQREMRGLQSSEREFTHELEEYSRIEHHTSAALRLVDPRWRTAIEKRYRDGATIVNLCVSLGCIDEKTVWNNLQYAYKQMDRLLERKLTANLFPFCARFVPEIFPQTSRRVPVFHRDLVLT